MKICVLGDGGWGTALAMVLDRNGHEVSVWGPFSEQVKSIIEAGKIYIFTKSGDSHSLHWTSDMTGAIADAECVDCGSVKVYHETVEQLAPLCLNQYSL